MDSSLTVEIEAGDENAAIDIPTALIEALSEPGDSPAEVVADVAVMSFTGRAHALLHHGEGEPTEALEDAEATMMERFEERFGVTYAEATGHSH